MSCNFSNKSIFKGSKTTTRDETQTKNNLPAQAKLNEQKKTSDVSKTHANKSKNTIKPKVEASEPKSQIESKALEEEKLSPESLKKKVFLRTDSGRFMSTKGTSNTEINEGSEVELAKNSDTDSAQRRLSSRPKQPNKRYATDDEEKQPLIRRFRPDDSLISKVNETKRNEIREKLKLKSITNKRNNSSSRTSTTSSLSVESDVTEAVKEQLETEKTESEKSTTDESESISAKSETTTTIEQQVWIKREDSFDKMEWSTEDEEVLSKYEKSIKQTKKKSPEEEFKSPEANQESDETKVHKSTISSPAKFLIPQKSPLKNETFVQIENETKHEKLVFKTTMKSKYSPLKTR